MDNGQQLINIAEAGFILSLTEYSKEEKIKLLIVLLDIEDLLDKGRGLVLDPKTEIISEISNKMDRLRESIRDLINGMDKNEVKNILQERGESLKSQFSIV